MIFWSVGTDFTPGKSPRLRLAGPGNRILPVEGVWRDRVLVKSVAPRFDGSRLSQKVGQLRRQY